MNRRRDSFVPEACDGEIMVPRLRTLFERAASKKLTLVTGPAGLGKTVQAACLARALEGRPGHRVVWVSSSCETSFDDLLSRTYDPSLKFLIVIDDCQSLHGGQSEKKLGKFVSQTPPHVHVMLIGRSIVPEAAGLLLSRLRVNREIVEISADDLALSCDEVRDFFKGANIAVSSDESTHIHSLTRGWAMGLKMLALMLKGVRSKDVQGVVDEFEADNCYICDFLREEVLCDLTENERSFVFATSGLEVFSASLGFEIAAIACDSRMVTRLVEVGLLVNAPTVCRQGERHEAWYAYHPLFSKSLQRIACSEASSDSVANAKARAIGWYERQGLYGLAIRTALSCGEHDRAFDLISAHLYPILTSIDSAKLSKWLSELPVPDREGRYVYYLVNAWANFICGKTKRAQMWLRQAEEVYEFEANRSCYRGVEGVYRAVKVACMVFAGDYEKAIELGVSSLANLGGPQLFLRCTIMHNLGEALERLGRYQEAYEYFVRAKVNAEMSGRRTVELLCACEMGRLHLLMGDLDVSSNLLLRTVGACDPEELRSSWPCALLNVGLARVYVHWGNANKALEYLEPVLRVLRPDINRDGYLEAQVVLAQVKQMQGENEEAYDILVGAYEMLKLDKVPRGINLLVLVTFADVLLGKGLVCRCREVLAEARSCMTEGDIHYRMLADSVAVRLCIEQGEGIFEAEQLLATSCARARDAHLDLVLQEGNVVLACAWQAMGDNVRALDLMAESLQAAASQGQMHAFLRPIPFCKSLVFSIAYPTNDNLVLTAHRETARLFAESVLASYGEDASIDVLGMPYRSEGFGDGDAVATLSAREVQVLELLKQGKTRKQMASELGIQVNTVRTHVRNVYRKCGVRTMAQKQGCNIGFGKSAAAS